MNATLIVDQHQRYNETLKKNQKTDVSHEAKALNQLVVPFGNNPRRIALVDQNDEKGIRAYQQAGFEMHTISSNGHRNDDIQAFIEEMQKQLEIQPPRFMFLVSTDPIFGFLGRSARNREVEFSIWAPQGRIPRQFREYDCRPLEELIPEIKVPRVGIYLDFENIHIGLAERGWKSDPKELIQAIKAEGAELGEVVTVVAYGDWSLLTKQGNRDLQRELTMLGVDTRYQVNMRGKNSADMKIADDIRTLVERDANAPDAIDIVILGTCDRDFRPTVETARLRGQKLFILSLEDGISRDLRQTAGEQNIRYIDRRLSFTKASVNLNQSYINLLIEIEAWLQQNRWQWAFADKLTNAITSTPSKLAQLEQAIADGVLVEKRRNQAKVINFSQDNPLAQAVQRVVRMIPSRIQYCLEEKGMPYVDSNFLARGMQMDATLKRLNVGQNRKDANEWLERLEHNRVIRKISQPHPKDPNHIIDTWRLTEIEKTTVEESVPVTASPLPVSCPKNSTATAATKVPRMQRPQLAIPTIPVTSAA